MVTPLHIAIREKNVDVTRVLLEFWANFSLENKARETPLDQAINLGNLELTSINVEQGYGFDLHNKGGNTTLLRELQKRTSRSRKCS